jgi:hypothetical protein
MKALLLAMLAASPLLQAPRDARVTVTVVDQTGAVIQNATVTVAAPEGAAAPPPSQTNDKGVASVAGLAPGVYDIRVEFPGFETRTLKAVRLRAGDNRHVAVLAIQGLQDSVTVQRDAREAASDRRSTFGTALTREQIDALSDDPDEMAQQLQDMAGGNAVIRVDSFEGGRLPPKSMIKSIHITRDAFAAENHYAGGIFIDIITQPGAGPLRTSLNMRLRDGSMSGTPRALPHGTQQQKGPERLQTYNGGISGSLIRQKASFSINVNSNTSFDTPYFHYRDPDGTLVEGLAPRRPRDNMYLFGNLDYAISRDQTLRVRYNREQSTSRNLGVGGVDLLERGYASEDASHQVMFQEAGPLGRRFFINTRGWLRWSRSDSSSVFEGPTIVVLDSFTAGGQQRSGGVRSKGLNLQSDLDYVRGRHSLRTGIQLDGGTYHSDDAQNYLGTYTFESLAAFNRGQPNSYTIRVGSPDIGYRNLQAGVYVQDDIRVRKNLTLSPGLRYEAQTHLADYDNFGPRFGVTYSPGTQGKTTLRGSAGVFYDWLPTGTYEQTLRVDGQRQRELNIPDPSFPVPPSGGGQTTATNRYFLSNELQMQQTTRVSAGIDRALTRMVRVNATYAYTRGAHLMRGLNHNAPLPGSIERPDPAFANVVEVVGDAASRQHTLNIGSVVNFNVTSPGSGPVMLNNGAMVIVMAGGPAGAAPGGAKNPANARWNWHRMQMFMNFSVGRALNDTDGAFSTPAADSLAADWGPSNFDIRRRFNINWSSTQLRNFSANISFNASSAQPYTIRSGIDTNHDLVYNDRPDGIGRNSARGSAQWTMNGYFSYGWQFGKAVQTPGGLRLGAEGGALTATQGAASTAGRYRLTLNVNVQNLTNHGNLGGYIGTLTSNDFGRPTVVVGTRKIDIGVGISF